MVKIRRKIKPQFIGIAAFRWSERRDSNSRPFDPQSNALNQAALRSDLIF